MTLRDLYFRVMQAANREPRSQSGGPDYTIRELFALMWERSRETGGWESLATPYMCRKIFCFENQP